MIDQFIIEAIKYKGSDLTLSELDTLRNIQEEKKEKNDFSFMEMKNKDLGIERHNFS